MARRSLEDIPRGILFHTLVPVGPLPVSLGKGRAATNTDPWCSGLCSIGSYWVCTCAPCTGCTSSASVNCPLLLLSHSSPPCLPPHVLWHYRSLSVEPKLLGNDDAAPGGRLAPDRSPGGHSQVDVKSPPSAGAAPCGQQAAAQPERRLLLPGQVHAR